MPNPVSKTFSNDQPVRTLLSCSLDHGSARDGAGTLPVPVKIDSLVMEKIDGFFDLLQKNRVDEAYDSLTKGTEIGKKEEEVSGLKAKTNEAIKLYGEVTGKDLVSVQTVGPHLMRATVLSLGSTYPLRWRFYFYKDSKSWRLIDIRVDDRLIDMFDERTLPAASPPPR